MFIRLMGYRAWANRLLLDWCVPTVVEDAYCVKLGAHILQSEGVWLERLLGLAAETEPWTPLPVDQWMTRREQNEAEWAEVLRGDLARRIRYRRRDNQESESRVHDILAQICFHSAYHRGQIAAQANRLDLHPPATDFIVFARQFPED